MNFLAILRKLFLGGTWYVGLRKLGEKNNKYLQVNTPKGQWIADPFLYEVDGKTYLFVEQYFTDKQRASIGVYDIVEGEAVNNRIIIENTYHMSYPCVFKYKGKHYMIPESSANSTIDLYVATDFPNKWKHVKSLIKGVKYVDSTIFESEDCLYLFTYKIQINSCTLVVFSLDMNSLELKFISEKYYKSNMGRPAGLFFNENGHIIRPAQDCSKKYGESLILYSVTDPKKGNYSEEKYRVIDANKSQYENKIDRIHTYNRSSLYEVIDVFKERIDLLHGIKIIRRAYLKH